MKTSWRKASILIACMLISASIESREAGSPSTAIPVSTFAREMLTSHNAIREHLNLPPLQWSNQLAAFAQKWADTLLAKNWSSHNPNSPYGENIFVSGIGSTPSMAVKEWASESRDYRYRTNSCSADCGHYTQIVWRNTINVGCGVARNARREIWVCSYDPPGNYRGEWPY